MNIYIYFFTIYFLCFLPYFLYKKKVFYCGGEVLVAVLIVW